MRTVRHLHLAPPVVTKISIGGPFQQSTVHTTYHTTKSKLTVMLTLLPEEL